jgi:hypothetical protein
MLLSNYHIFLGDKNTPILQPGPYDNGVYPDDVVGYVERYIEVKPPPDTNLIDACLARPVSQDIVSDEVLDIGIVNGIEEAKVGMRVAKSGRSTNYAEAIIQDTEVTVKVDGYEWGEAIFEDQIITNYLGAPGDSGSCVCNVATKAAVGLLFAGSGTLTVLNKMTNVASLLNIDVPRVAVTPAVPTATAAYLLAPLFTGILLVLGAKQKL